jgi:hypothetical protein
VTVPFQPQAAVPPPSPVPTRKGPWLWILAGLSAALLVAVGGLGYLLSAENTSSQSELDQQDAQIADLEGRVDDLENVNERSENEVGDLRDELADNQTLIRDLTECPTKVQFYLDAIGGSESVLLDAIDEMVASCHIAG